MPRPAQTRTAMTLAILALIVLSLSPRPVADVAAWLHGPATVLLAPISRPAQGVVSWFRSERRDLPGGEAYVRGLERQVDDYKLAFFQARSEADSLREVVRALSETQKLNPARVRVTLAAVIGASMDLSAGTYTVQAGTREGVRPRDVVVVGGVNILGRVASVDQRTCVVQPVFSRTADKLDGVVMLPEDRLGPTCQLSPSTGGRLVGRLEDTTEPTGTGLRAVVEPGMIVRLNDARWPPSSRMLVVGVVERVDPMPGAPLRQMVTVMPAAGVAGASEVMIRTAEYGEDAASPAVPAAGAGHAPGGRR